MSIACLVEAVLGLMSLLAAGATAEPDNTPLKPFWMVQPSHPCHPALTEGLGFSFRYDGRKVEPARPEDWQISSEDDGRCTWLRHPSGLAVQRSVRVLPEFEAVEYTLSCQPISALCPTVEELAKTVALTQRFNYNSSP